MLIHIILGILKVIGIILLLILALLLLLLLSLLFVPVRYYGKAYKDDSGYEGIVKISWMFRCISMTGIYGSDPEQNGVKFRLMGIRLETLKKIFARLGEIKRRRAEKAKNKKNGKKVKKDNPQNPELTAMEIRESHEESFSVKDEASACAGKAMKREANEREKKEEPVTKGNEGKFEGLLHKCGKRILKIFSLPSAIRRFLKNMYSSLYGLYEKAAKFYHLLKSDSFIDVKKTLIGELKFIFGHVRPRKVRGSLSFGFSDPALTGQILAAAGVFYPLYGRTMAIHPYFDREILEGNIEVKGKIQGFIFLHTAWVLLRNPNIKDIIKKFKH